MSGGLFRRHFLLTAGMILVSFALMGVTFITLSYQYTIRERQDTMMSNAQAVASFTAAVRANHMSIEDENFRLTISAVAQISDSYVVLAERTGEVVFSSDGSLGSDYAGITLPRSVVDSVLQTGSYSGMSTLGGMYEDSRFTVGLPIALTLNGQEYVMGLAFVAARPAALTEMWSAFSAIFFFTAVVVLIIAFISSSITSMHQVKPLKEMAGAVRRFGQGEFDVRVNDYGRTDEVGELAAAFNSMANALANSEARRREFISNISHELKTPMTTIAGFADGILDGTIPPEKSREALQVVSSETRRLSRLVRRMLDLSQLQAREGAPISAQEQFNVAEVMCQVLVSLEGKINGRSLDVDAQIPEEPVMVWGDPDSITQVCYNLLDNAIKFSAPGGTIGITVTTKGPKACVAVRNRGETIPPEELPLVFDRFHKSDRSRSVDKEGVGLGLYIVKTILNNHKESITVTSQDGVTEFVFTLTLAK